jgi:DNA repair protein RecN (Recombination protein N)
MLKTLRIRNFAIIEDLTVEFTSGLNLLTGETGAGKSIVVDALGLAAGDRADSSMIRSGEEKAVVEAVYGMARGSAIQALLDEKGVDAVGDELIVRREIAASGSGRVFVNGSPTTVSVLREAGNVLVELHGQHEHQSLLSSDRQLDLVDQFGGLDNEVREVREAFEAVREARSRLEEVESRSRERGERSAMLQARLAEIDAVAPRPGELEELNRERGILRHAGQMATLLGEAVGLLYEGDPAASSLAAAGARRAAELAGIDPGLQEIAQRIDAARVELEDAGAALREYRDRANFDPARLETLESRRAALETLLLRYGPDEQSAIQARNEAAAELERLGDLEAEVERAGQALAKAEATYIDRAEALGRARAAAANRMGPQVEDQFRALALGGARFRVEFSPARGETIGDARRLPLGPRGAERGEFLLSANPGESARPLARVASGGELSRVMLALHVVLEQAGRDRTLVFDEVDAGIGGAVADAVGSRLAELSGRHQVLCVTHLPQVAAHADRHYHVAKRVVGKRTRAEVEPLTGDARVAELARMLGGREITAASRRNAQELIAGASRQKTRRKA